MDRVAKRQAAALAAGGPGLAAIAVEAFQRHQRILHKRWRQIVLGHLGKRLEDLEVMPPAAVQNTTWVSIGGQPGTAQAISDTMTVSSSASAKRARVHSRTRSSAASWTGLFLVKPSMAKQDQGTPGRGQARPGLMTWRMKGSERGRNSTGGGAHRAEQDRNPRLSDAGHSGGCRAVEDGGRRHLRHRRQALQAPAVRRAGDHGAREYRHHRQGRPRIRATQGI